MGNNDRLPVGRRMWATLCKFPANFSAGLCDPVRECRLHARPILPPNHDPLKRFNTDKHAILVDYLMKAPFFGKDKSNEEMAKGPTNPKPNHCAHILSSDVTHVFSFFAANRDYDTDMRTGWERV